MKRIISTTAFLLAFIATSTAQGNLQFNRVVNGNTSPVTFNYATQTLGTIVVPAGKVLKIQSTSYTRTASGDTYPLSYYVYIDRHIGWGGSNDLRQNFPLWLPEGTYTITADGGIEVDCIFTYSAIEFNIVP